MFRPEPQLEVDAYSNDSFLNCGWVDLDGLFSYSSLIFLYPSPLRFTVVLMRYVPSPPARMFAFRGVVGCFLSSHVVFPPLLSRDPFQSLRERSASLSSTGVNCFLGLRPIFPNSTRSFLSSPLLMARFPLMLTSWSTPRFVSWLSFPTLKHNPSCDPAAPGPTFRQYRWPLAIGVLYLVCGPVQVSSCTLLLFLSCFFSREL